MNELAIRTTCPYCGVGCGIRALQQENTAIVSGDPDHPANYGRLCSKGSALGDTLDLEGRLLYPEIEGQQVSWEQALDTVAERLKAVIARYGPDAVAFYISGQLLTEDYYVANKLMKGFIGSANIDTNSRLCMASSVAGHKRAFGEDIVPGNYEDLEQADLVVLAGSNLAWCHPVLYQRLQKARQERSGKPKLVVIDPRRTATCDGVELHLALKPGTDTVLFNGLLTHLYQQDRLNIDYLELHTEGFWGALRAAREVAPSIPAVARQCGLSEQQVAEFYSLFARTEKTVTVYSQGVNQSSYGSDKVNSIINCHLATGRIGKIGMGPFSVTGQPNAMGGREVGGLANQLAVHMDFTPEEVDRVQRFWHRPLASTGAEGRGKGCIPRMAAAPGLKAVELFKAVAEGKIKAIWIMATNPVVSLPDADAVRAALKACEWVIVSDAQANTDTVALARIRLPALTWGEKDGTVTNSERRISRQRAFLPGPGEARADWWIITQVAQRLGFAEAFPYQGPAAIFREHAALSGFENDGQRLFDISGLAALSEAEYDTLKPVRWPVPAGTRTGTARLFSEGRFATANGRACFMAIGERIPVHTISEDFPLVLNTGRVRDHWHTLTRTGKSPRLSAHVVESYAELNPVDALAHGIQENMLIRLFSCWGEVIVRARLSPDQQPGSVFVPMHWGSPYASRGRIDAVVNPVTDPVSGQPESKHTPVRIQPYRPAWQGFVLSRIPLEVTGRSELNYWVSARGHGFWRYELASETTPADWAEWAHNLWTAGSEWIDYLDRGAGCYRGAAIVEGRLQCCVFVAPNHQLPPRSWLEGLFAKMQLERPERAGLLAGCPPGKAQVEGGQVVCACFSIGLNTLIKTIREQRLTTPEQVGAILKAGTNCGSCLPELRKLIAQLA